MSTCNKCGKDFISKKGLKHYCSLKCRNSRGWSEEDKLKKSLAAKLSAKVLEENSSRRGKPSKLKKQRVESKCLFCNQSITHKVSVIRKYHKSCWLQAGGGYRKGSSRGKCGWYKGHWCDSSYELVWIIYNLDHNISFERNKDKYQYEWRGLKHNYIPDFIQDGVIIEIKGFTTPQTEEKFKSVPNLKILYRKDLNKEFEYVENKYGKDFIKLYER